MHFLSNKNTNTSPSMNWFLCNYNFQDLSLLWYVYTYQTRLDRYT